MFISVPIKRKTRSKSKPERRVSYSSEIHSLSIRLLFAETWTASSNRSRSFHAGSQCFLRLKQSSRHSKRGLLPRHSTTKPRRKIGNPRTASLAAVLSSMDKWPILEEARQTTLSSCHHTSIPATAFSAMLLWPSDWLHESIIPFKYALLFVLLIDLSK